MHPGFTPYRDSLVCRYCSKCLFTGCLKSSREVKLGPNPRLTALPCLTACVNILLGLNTFPCLSGAKLIPKPDTAVRGIPSYTWIYESSQRLSCECFLLLPLLFCGELVSGGDSGLLSHYHSINILHRMCHLSLDT